MADFETKRVKESLGIAENKNWFYQRFNRFKINEGYDPYSSGIVYVFFTKPELNIMDEDEVGKRTNANYNQTFATKFYNFITDDKYNERNLLGKLIDAFSNVFNLKLGGDSLRNNRDNGKLLFLDYLEKVGLGDFILFSLNYDFEITSKLKNAGFVKTNFIPILTNAIKNFDTKDIDMISSDKADNFYGQKIRFGNNFIESEGAGTLSLTFQEHKDLLITYLHKVWVDYIAGVRNGYYIPKLSNITHKIIDYTCSIYFILCDVDGRTIKYWSKYTGVYPSSVPYSTFTWRIGDNSVRDVNIQYEYSFKEDLNPEILLNDFNSVTGARVSDLEYSFLSQVESLEEENSKLLNKISIEKKKINEQEKARDVLSKQIKERGNLSENEELLNTIGSLDTLKASLNGVKEIIKSSENIIENYNKQINSNKFKINLIRNLLKSKDSFSLNKLSNAFKSNSGNWCSNPFVTYEETEINGIKQGNFYLNWTSLTSNMFSFDNILSNLTKLGGLADKFISKTSSTTPISDIIQKEVKTKEQLEEDKKTAKQLEKESTVKVINYEEWNKNKVKIFTDLFSSTEKVSNLVQYAIQNSEKFENSKFFNDTDIEDFSIKDFTKEWEKAIKEGKVDEFLEKEIEPFSNLLAKESILTISAPLPSKNGVAISGNIKTYFPIANKDILGNERQEVYTKSELNLIAEKVEDILLDKITGMTNSYKALIENKKGNLTQDDVTLAKKYQREILTTENVIKALSLFPVSSSDPKAYKIGSNLTPGSYIMMSEFLKGKYSNFNAFDGERNFAYTSLNHDEELKKLNDIVLKAEIKLEKESLSKSNTNFGNNSDT